MEKLKIRRFGKKRSIVFAYNCTDENEIINALANEENPMGVIGGDFSKQVQNENIAQYDTAQVYVSHETMFEKCKEINIIGDERLEYNAIEIFFVELILFQDAAIDKIYIDLQEETDKQRGYRDVNEATERYEQLSFDMAMAIRFGDYEQFNYPTVRASARKIAQSFGLELIYEKYRLNKELLATMIESNKRKIQERQDRIKNFFLLLLSALSIIPTLGEILQSIFADNHDEIFCYAISLAIVLVGFAIYKLIGVLDIAAAKRAAENVSFDMVLDLMKQGYYIMLECMYNYAHWLVLLGYYPLDNSTLEKSSLLVYDPYYNNVRLLNADEFIAMWIDGNYGNTMVEKDFIAIRKKQ